MSDKEARLRKEQDILERIENVKRLIQMETTLVTGSEKRHFYRIYRYLLEEFLGRRLSNEELEYLI